MAATVDRAFASELCGYFASGQPEAGLAVRSAGMMLCEAGEGDAVVVPGEMRRRGWWHATCNLSPWAAGFTWLDLDIDALNADDLGA